MGRKQGKKSGYILVLLALGAMALTFHLGVASALATCSGDTDCDGFSDGVENAGISPLNPGLSLTAYPSLTSLGKCPSGPSRETCVDPLAKDLFVIIQRATGCPTSKTCNDPCAPTFGGKSDIPMPPYDTTLHINPLGLIYAVGGNTPVTTHELTQSAGYTSQLVGPVPPADGWYAVKIVENMDPCYKDKPMGQATFPYFPASPTYTGASATVWPERIKNWIANACSQACFDTNGDGTPDTCYTPTTLGVNSFKCMNSVSKTTVDMKNPIPDLVQKLNGEFIQNIVSHEASHLMNLAAGTGVSADHHWPKATGYLMEQTIGTKATKDKSGNIVVNLYISTGYAKQDTGVYLLR